MSIKTISALNLRTTRLKILLNRVPKSKGKAFVGDEKRKFIDSTVD
jgi:hypothetical protein